MWGLALRPATPEDAEWIAGVEARPDMLPYIGGSTVQQHLAAMVDANLRYLIGEAARARRGYAILTGLIETPGTVCLKRIAVPEPGQGLGRAVLRLLVQHVFERLGAERLTLTVFEDNPRARHLYAAFGYVFDATAPIREVIRRDGTSGRLLPMVLTAARWRG